MSPARLFLLAGVVATMLGESAGAQPRDISAFQLETHYDVRTNGNDSTYGQGLTHRRVSGELRFLTIVHPGLLHEFRIANAAPESTITDTTGVWDLRPTGAVNDFMGIWFEEEKNRLWMVSAQDYTSEHHPARITLLALGDAGAVTVLKAFFLDVPAKRVYGGCNAVPPSLQIKLSGQYVCGWGGYTSLVEQGGGASIGPTMYSLPDPDSITHGSMVRVRTIIDHAGSRGVRKTIPTAYFDGGDPRQNPSERPTQPPLRSTPWRSPNGEGLGWMTWGDSYYNTGFWIGTTFGAVASLCKGACWYQSSTLAFDGRQFELHLWNGSQLGRELLQRPDVMAEVDLPIDNARVWLGNVPTGNITGATYDTVSRRLFLIGFPLAGPHTGRLYAFSVDADALYHADNDGSSRRGSGPSVGTARPR